MVRKNAILINLKIFFWLFIIQLFFSCVANQNNAKRTTVDLFTQSTGDTAVTTTTTTTTVTRPTKQVFLQRDFCSCLSGKADILSNCTTFCASKTETVATLFVDTQLGSDVTLNTKLGNLLNWCTVPLNDGEQNLSCKLNATDGTTTTNLTINTLSSTSNSFSVNINSLEKNKTFILTLKVFDANENVLAESDSIQIKRIDLTTATNNLGPLKISPISEYTCIKRSGTVDTTTKDESYEKAVRVHFYHPHNKAPTIVPPGDNFIFCHDVAVNKTDNALLPRLELKEGTFHMWSDSDIRFFDTNSDNQPDINVTIQQKLINEFNVDSATANAFTIFSELRWPSAPLFDTAGNNTSTGSDALSNSTAPRLGFVMQAFINQDTQDAFCPTQTEYNGTQSIFKVLREVVGIDTEGLYLATREPETFTNSSGEVENAPTDLILIREGLLKQVWFYRSEGKLIKPDDTTAKTKQIMLFWPPNPTNPFIKSSQQKVYLVKSPEELSSTLQSGLQTTIRPSDKRIACIPKT